MKMMDQSINEFNDKQIKDRMIKKQQREEKGNYLYEELINFTKIKNDYISRHLDDNDFIRYLAVLEYKETIPYINTVEYDYNNTPAGNADIYFDLSRKYEQKINKFEEDYEVCKGLGIINKEFDSIKKFIYNYNYDRGISYLPFFNGLSQLIKTILVKVDERVKLNQEIDESDLFVLESALSLDPFIIQNDKPSTERISTVEYIKEYYKYAYEYLSNLGYISKSKIRTK